MPCSRLVRRAAALMTVAVVTPGAPAAAQGPPASAPAINEWTAVVGVQHMSLRDVARTGPPVDASPVARDGSGPVFVVEYRHSRPDRLHRLEFCATYTDDFSYVSSRGTAVLPPEDDATSLEARYEYRRFPFRDVGGLRGFDVGVGVEVILDRAALSRSFAPAIVITDALTRGGAGVVAAARLRRWSAVQFEAAWTNAALLARAAQSHTVDPLAHSVQVGPGWITDLDAIASIRVADHLSLVVAYRQSGEGLLGTRPAWAIGRSRAIVGAEYVR